MFITAASALVYVERRRLFDVFPNNVKQAWKTWEVQLLIFFSLIFQLVLVVLGHRRKYMAKKTRIRFLIWSSYLLADWVATVALGVISQNTLDHDPPHHPHCPSPVADPTAMVELMSFWAPFLLLHLGGPDTITAYALEDNALWLRHLVGLVVQTSLALYILLVAWPGRSWLPRLSLLIFCAGVIKFAERTLALRSANIDHLRNSMLTSPDPGPNYARFMEDFTLKKAEGFCVAADEVKDHPIDIDNSNRTDDKKLIPDAYDKFQAFKRLFVDLILSFQDRDSSQSYFQKLTHEQAFNVVEVELGFAFDMFYTKVPIVYSVGGCICRLLTFSCTFSALAFFVMLCKKSEYHIMNLILTYVLLTVAILLEIHGVIVQINSDWTICLLHKHDKIRKFPLIRSCSCVSNKQRWSRSMAQYNLLSFCLDEKPAVCPQVQKLLGIIEFREKHRYKTYQEVSTDLKDSIFNHFKKFIEIYESGTPALCTQQNGFALKTLLPEWTKRADVEFDQSMLMWHIATDLCYYLDEDENSSNSSRGRESKNLSDYMLYLLVFHPFMLPMGIGLIRFRDTCAEAKEFFKERGLANGKAEACEMVLQVNTEVSPVKVQACKMLLQVNTEVLPVKVKGDRSKSVLFDACRLAGELLSLGRDQKWDRISKVWVEMLAYAATHCRGNHHSQQLRRGGELLTHVWLLMAHLGITTEQFQINQGVNLVAK